MLVLTFVWFVTFRVVQFNNGVQLWEKLQKADFDPMWLDEGGHNEIEYETIVRHFKKFITFLKKKIDEKYTKQSVRELRLEKMKHSKKVASQEEGDGSQSKSKSQPAKEEPATSNTSRLPVSFVPNVIDQPVLREFDRFNKILAKEVRTVKFAKTAQKNAVSKAELRKKRLQAMQSTGSKDGSTSPE